MGGGRLVVGHQPILVVEGEQREGLPERCRSARRPPRCSPSSPPASAARSGRPPRTPASRRRLRHGARAVHVRRDHILLRHVVRHPARGLRLAAVTPAGRPERWVRPGDDTPCPVGPATSRSTIVTAAKAAPRLGAGRTSSSTDQQRGATRTSSGAPTPSGSPIFRGAPAADGSVCAVRPSARAASPRSRHHRRQQRGPAGVTASPPDARPPPSRPAPPNTTAGLGEVELGPARMVDHHQRRPPARPGNTTAGTSAGSPVSPAQQHQSGQDPPPLQQDPDATAPPAPTSPGSARPSSTDPPVPGRSVRAR